MMGGGMNGWFAPLSLEEAVAGGGDDVQQEWFWCLMMDECFVMTITITIDR